jgi:Uma2 family endonuclease
MNIDVSSLSLPIRLRPATALTDEELMRFSRKNRPYKIERDKQGEITVRTPVGGIGSTHEVFVASTLYLWNETTGGGVAFGSNAGFNLRDGSCLSPDAAWLSIERWTALSAEQQAGVPPLCPEFVIEIRSRTHAGCSRPRCSFGSTTARSLPGCLTLSMVKP